MTKIIDKRVSNKYSDNKSRREFIERNKKYLKQKVDEVIGKDSLKDLKDKKSHKVKIKKDLY